MVKLEANIGKGYYVPFEIQIFPKAMKEAYNESHKLYSTIKSDIEDWEKYCEIHDNIKTSQDLERAINEHPEFFNPQYKHFRNESSEKTDIVTFFSFIRHQAPYNVSQTHNQKVLDTLQQIMDIHYNAAKSCGLLDTKRFRESGNQFPRLEDADASVKEIEIEPLEGYEQMKQDRLLEQTQEHELEEARKTLGDETFEGLSHPLSDYTDEEIIATAKQKQEQDAQTRGSLNTDNSTPVNPSYG